MRPILTMLMPGTANCTTPSARDLATIYVPRCDEMSWSSAFTVKTLLIFLKYIFEYFLINTAPPASNSIYRQNFMWKSLEIIVKHLRLTFGDMAYFFHTNHAGRPEFDNFRAQGSLQFFLEHRLTFCNGKGIHSRNVLIGLIENHLPLFYIFFCLTCYLTFLCSSSQVTLFP